MAKSPVAPRFMGLRGMTVPPQWIYANRKYLKVVLEPPKFEPGSWRGAGNCVADATGQFWLVTRPRTKESRGYAFEIHSSENGEDLSLRFSMTKEILSDELGRRVLSIEGQQLLRDPLTGRYHLYLSVDIDRVWQTALLSSEDPCGPWKSEGIVIGCDQAYDSREARDAVIDVIEGKYFALYKASDGQRINEALAASSDGKGWKKMGLLELDGSPQPPFHFLYGRTVASSLGPMFVGFESAEVVRGAAVSRRFVSYILDYRSTNLETLFITNWEPLSPFERRDYPVHSYSDLVYDQERDRILLFIEAIDLEHSQDVGLNNEVDRVLLYEVPL